MALTRMQGTLPESRSRKRILLLVVFFGAFGGFCLLLGVVWGSGILANPAARRMEAMAQLNAITMALDMFYADLGRYPTTDEGVGILRTPFGRGPYIAKNLERDAWGNPFQYFCPQGGIPTVTSLGADGRSGGLVP